MKSPTNYIEFHDSKVESLIYFPGKELVIEFAHISVYQPMETNKFDIWSYRAKIVVEQFTEFIITGSLLIDDRVMDGNVTDEKGKELPLNTLLTKSFVDKIQLEFSSGSKIVLSAKHATLVLVDAVEKIDEWVGSLE